MQAWLHKIKTKTAAAIPADVSDAWHDVRRYRTNWRESQDAVKHERQAQRKQVKIDAMQDATYPQRIFGEIHVSLDAFMIGFGCGAGIWYNDYRAYHGGQGEGVESGDGIDDWYRQDKKMHGKEFGRSRVSLR